MRLWRTGGNQSKNRFIFFIFSISSKSSVDFWFVQNDVGLFVKFFVWMDQRKKFVIWEFGVRKSCRGSNLLIRPMAIHSQLRSHVFLKKCCKESSLWTFTTNMMHWSKICFQNVFVYQEDFAYVRNVVLINCFAPSFKNCCSCFSVPTISRRLIDPFHQRWQAEQKWNKSIFQIVCQPIDDKCKDTWSPLLPLNLLRTDVDKCDKFKLGNRLFISTWLEQVNLHANQIDWLFEQKSIDNRIWKYLR